LELFYREFGQGAPVVILHGLFGFSDNWQTIAKTISENHLVITPDLRNHGRSPHTPTHSFAEMASDLEGFMNDRWMFSATYVGHSMGGKVAMQMALTYPDMVERLIVVDIEPGISQSNHDDIFDALFSLDLESVQTRQDAEAFLWSRIKDQGTLQFLLKNITRDENGKYSWKMNLDTLHRDYANILAPVEGIPFEKPTLFIRGSNSDYIRDDEWPNAQRLFPNAQLITIEGAGHWVHADKPKELVDAIKAFIQ
jgi:esterase